jgi:hypothetical protein
MIFTYTAAFFFPLPDAEPAFLLFNKKSEEEKIVKQPEEGVAKKKKYFRVEFLPPPVVYSA